MESRHKRDMADSAVETERRIPFALGIIVIKRSFVDFLK